MRMSLSWFLCGFRTMHWIIRFLAVVVFALLSMTTQVPFVHSKWVEGQVRTRSSNWEFLTRFCFLSEKGRLEYEFRYPVGYGTLDILLYYDTPGQWESVYDRGLNCSEKTSVLSITSNQIISLNTSNTQTSSHSGCKLETYDGDTWYHCASIRAFSSTRERWWYIVLARCGQSKDQVSGLHANFKIHMTNGDDLMHEEYSADEFYILPVDIAFLILYLIIGVLSGICAVLLRQRHLFHSTYKLFLVSVYVWLLSLILKVTAWMHYGVTGWEWTSTEVSGRVAAGLSQGVFILMLILMGKGYTITRGYLQTSSVVKITVFISLYFIITVALFVWEGLFFDEAEVLYYYESPPGYCMVALQLVAWFWFLYSTIFTLKHTASKSLFYIPFFAFYTLWFWAGPIIVLVAMFAMPKWGREKTVNGTEQLLAFLGHLIFLVLTRPSAANSNFPYHVRTSQISSMKEDDDAHRESCYHFDKGNTSDYTITGTGPNLDFFITSSNNNNDDNISIINYNDNNNLRNSLSGERVWFNNIAPPPYTEQTSSVPVSYLPPPPPFVTKTLLPVAMGSSPHPESSLHPATTIPSRYSSNPTENVTAAENTHYDNTEKSVNQSLSSMLTPRDLTLSLAASPNPRHGVPVLSSLSIDPQPPKTPLALYNHPTVAATLDTKSQQPTTSNVYSPLPTTNNPDTRTAPPTTATSHSTLETLHKAPAPPSPKTLLSYQMLDSPNLPKPPTPRTNKHTFSSTIAILTKTADATNVDDVINENNNKSNKKTKKKNKEKGSVILSKSVEDRYSNGSNIPEDIDTASRNSLVPVGLPLLKQGDTHRPFPQKLPPLPVHTSLVSRSPESCSSTSKGDDLTTSSM